MANELLKINVFRPMCKTRYLWNEDVVEPVEVKPGFICRFCYRHKFCHPEGGSGVPPIPYERPCGLGSNPLILIE